jgi:hypothetical protein
MPVSLPTLPFLAISGHFNNQWKVSGVDVNISKFCLPKNWAKSGVFTQNIVILKNLS